MSDWYEYQIKQNKNKMLRQNLKCCRYLLFNKKKESKITTPPLKQKLQILKKLLPYTLPFLHKNKQVTHCLLKSYGYLALSKICFFVGPMLLKTGINNLNISHIDPTLYFLGYGILYIFNNYFQSLRNMQTSKIISFALTQLSTQVYSHMLGLDPQFFFSGSQRKKLFNLYKAQNAIEQNLRSLTQYFLPFFLDAAICSAILLSFADFFTMLVFISCYSSYAVFTIMYSNRRKFHVNAQRQSQKKLDFISSQTFANYYNVKYFRKQQYEVKKYEKALNAYYQHSKKTQQSLGILNTVQRIIFAIGIMFNLIIGASGVKRGIMSIGDVIMIQTLMLQFLSPLFFLGSTYRNFIDTFVELKQLFDTIKKLSQVTQGTKQLQQIKGQIIFNNVNFYYNNSTNINNNISSQVLNNINFKIKPGQFVGFIGQSGSGKTTILNLIFRLFDPISGSILLDGENIKNLKFTFIDHITFVSQTPYLFNGTVLQNLKYGSPQTTKQQIQHYTKALGIHDVIMQLPQQYNSNVGQKGNKFSGGQKQRISLIRALLKKVPIMLLDEPTSSLDYTSQQKVINILQQYQGTKLMITHRHNLLKYFDQVIQIKKL